MSITTKTVTAYPQLAHAGEVFRAGRYEEAAKVVISHLRAHPNDPNGIALLGAIAMRLGALGQAEQFLRKAIALGSGSTDVQRNLASTLNQQGRSREALELFDALQRNNDDPTITASRALLLDKLGRSSDARALLENLVEKCPDQPAYWLSYGHHLRSSNQTEEAVAAYRRATELDLERGEAWWGLANIKTRILTDDDMAAMERALAIAVDIVNVAPLHFALARGWHDRKNFERAFHHYAQGNRLQAEAAGYRAKELTDEVDESIELFDRAFFERSHTPQNAQVIPVFIVSLPRSGSTLLEQMLGNHPDIESLGELPYIQALLRSLMETHTQKARVTVPQLIHRLSEAEKVQVGEEYLRRAAEHRQTTSPVFVDKLPHNWSNTVLIRQILPQARFIDIRRSAMDCCFSNFTQSFSRAHAASFALADIGQCFVDYVRLMDHLDRAVPGLVHHVNYERLVEEPETELRATFDYLGLAWNDASLRFYQSKKPVRTPSVEQVRRPLNREGIGVWKPYSQWLGPLREVLGPLAKA